jgi:hypothetical protein
MDQIGPQPKITLLSSGCLDARGVSADKFVRPRFLTLGYDACFQPFHPLADNVNGLGCTKKTGK